MVKAFRAQKKKDFVREERVDYSDYCQKITLQGHGREARIHYSGNEGHQKRPGGEYQSSGN